MSQFYYQITDRFKEVRKNISTPITHNKGALIDFAKNLPKEKFQEIFTYENEQYLRLMLDSTNKMQAILKQHKLVKTKLLSRSVLDDRTKYELNLQTTCIEAYYRKQNKQFDVRSYSLIFSLWSQLELNIVKVNPTARGFQISPHSDQYEQISGILTALDYIYPDFLTQVTILEKYNYLVMTMIQNLYQEQVAAQFVFGQPICLIATVTLLYISSVEAKLVSAFQQHLMDQPETPTPTPTPCFADRIEIAPLIIDCDNLEESQSDLDALFFHPRRLWNQQQHYQTEYEDIIISDAFRLMQHRHGRRKMSFETEKEKKAPMNSFQTTLNRMDIHYNVIDVLDLQMQQSHFGLIVPPVLPTPIVPPRKDWIGK